MIRVPVQTFNRIANAVGDDPSRPFCHCVLIEVTASGKVFAIASDGKILACERIGFVQGLPASQTIIRPLPQHKSGDVVIVPGAVWVEVNGMPIDFLQPINETYINWRFALPKTAPKKPVVPVSFSSRHLLKLASTSPSGGLVFPDFIAMDSSIVVNDADVPEWFGLYMPVVDGDKKNLQPAILPGWFE
jgi:hypothetical protein